MGSRGILSETNVDHLLSTKGVQQKPRHTCADCSSLAAAHFSLVWDLTAAQENRRIHRHKFPSSQRISRVEMGRTSWLTGGSPLELDFLLRSPKRFRYRFGPGCCKCHQEPRWPGTLGTNQCLANRLALRLEVDGLRAPKFSSCGLWIQGSISAENLRT